MPIYELVKQDGDTSGTIWYCVDRLHRKPLTTQTEVDAYQDFIARRGQSAIVQSVKLLPAFGVDVSVKANTLELVKQRGDTSGTIWFAVNRATRTPVKAASIADYQFWLGKAGYDAAVHDVANVDSFGKSL